MYENVQKAFIFQGLRFSGRTRSSAPKRHRGSAPDPRHRLAPSPWFAPLTNRGSGLVPGCSTTTQTDRQTDRNRERLGERGRERDATHGSSKFRS